MFFTKRDGQFLGMPEPRKDNLTKEIIERPLLSSPITTYSVQNIPPVRFNQFQGFLSRGLPKTSCSHCPH